MLPSGNFAYATNSASNDISIYSIDAATGALTLIGTIGT
ncbi:MAG: beta-propeller fold lactonase family protein [Candidatus Acidiferrales bacterium]